jgi:hypothetical protein
MVWSGRMMRSKRNEVAMARARATKLEVTTETRMEDVRANVRAAVRATVGTERARNQSLRRSSKRRRRERLPVSGTRRGRDVVAADDIARCDGEAEVGLGLESMFFNTAIERTAA